LVEAKNHQEKASSYATCRRLFRKSAPKTVSVGELFAVDPQSATALFVTVTYRPMTAFSTVSLGRLLPLTTGYKHQKRMLDYFLSKPNVRPTFLPGTKFYMGEMSSLYASARALVKAQLPLPPLFLD